MPHSATGLRAAMPSRVGGLGAAALVVLVLALSAQALRAAEAPSKAGSDTTVIVKAFPPSVQVDATKDDGGDVSSAAKRSQRLAADATSHGLRFDSDDDFDAVVQKMPWIIGLIFLIVGSIFLTPIVLLVGIIWYKLRKAKLQNEAMLRLAEKGVVPPAQAADALASGASPAAAAPLLYQQAIAMRKRVVWSDLRKGVILSTLGLAFSFYWLVSAGEPSWLGLVLLFVGVGYVVLWWLEGRHLQRSNAGGDSGHPGMSGS
jgi:hypothetical protein